MTKYKILWHYKDGILLHTCEVECHSATVRAALKRFDYLFKCLHEDSPESRYVVVSVDLLGSPFIDLGR